MNTLGFIFCVEPGYLEAQAVLLARSIRAFCGDYAQAPLYAYSPRGAALGEATVAELESLGVVINTEDLNQYPFYPCGNKIFACAHAEQHCKEDTLVFVDTDTVFFRQPDDLICEQDEVIKACPVWYKGIATNGEDQMADYWAKAHQLCGLEFKFESMTTLADHQKVNRYLNAGLMSVRREVGFFRHWKQDFERLMDENLIPFIPEIKDPWTDYASPARNMDQISLAIGVERFVAGFKYLDGSYNYPLHARDHLAESYKTLDLDQIYQLHYNFFFQMEDILERMALSFSRETDQFRFLEQNLPLRVASEASKRAMQGLVFK